MYGNPHDTTELFKGGYSLGSGLATGGGNSFNFLDSMQGLGNFLGSPGGQGLLGLGSLALQGYGLNKTLDFNKSALDLQRQQEERAATAQNLATNNSLSLALQMTTPGTAEHEQVKKAIEAGQYAV